MSVFFFLCDFGAFAGDMLLGPRGFSAQKHIGISRKGAETQRREFTEGLQRLC
jgi:hydrogenase maturation factor HypE